MGRLGPPPTSLAPPRPAKSANSMHTTKNHELLQDVRKRIKEFAARWDVRSVLQHGSSTSRDACTGAARALLSLAGYLTALKAHARAEIRHALTQELDWSLLLPVLLSQPDATATCAAAVEQLARCLTGLIPQDGISTLLCRLINPDNSASSTVQMAARALLALLPQWHFATFWSTWQAVGGPQRLLDCLCRWLPSSMQTWQTASSASMFHKCSTVTRATRATEGSWPVGSGSMAQAAAPAPAAAMFSAVEDVLQLQLTLGRISHAAMEHMAQATVQARWLWCLSGWLLLCCREDSPAAAMELPQHVTRLLLEQLSLRMWHHDSQPEVTLQLLLSLEQLLSWVSNFGERLRGSKQAVAPHVLAAAAGAMQLLSHPRLWCAACCSACHSTWLEVQEHHCHMQLAQVGSTIPAALSVLQLNNGAQQEIQAGDGSGAPGQQYSEVEHGAAGRPAGKAANLDPEAVKFLEAAVQLSVAILSHDSMQHSESTSKQHSNTASASMSQLQQPVSSLQPCPGTTTAAQHLLQATPCVLQAVDALWHQASHNSPGTHSQSAARSHHEQSPEAIVLCQLAVWLLAQRVPDAVLSYVLGLHSKAGQQPTTLLMLACSSAACHSSHSTANTMQEQQKLLMQCLNQHQQQQQQDSAQHTVAVTETDTTPARSVVQAAKSAVQGKEQRRPLMVDGLCSMVGVTSCSTVAATAGSIAAVQCIKQLAALCSTLSVSTAMCISNLGHGHHHVSDGPLAGTIATSGSTVPAEQSPCNYPTVSSAGLLNALAAVQQLQQLLAPIQSRAKHSWPSYDHSAAASRHRLLVSVMQMSYAQIALSGLLHLAKSPAAEDLQVLHQCAASPESIAPGIISTNQQPLYSHGLAAKQDDQRASSGTGAVYVMALLRDSLQQVVCLATCTCCAWTTTQDQTTASVPAVASDRTSPAAVVLDRHKLVHEFEGSWQFPACPVHCYVRSSACMCATSGILQSTKATTANALEHLQHLVSDLQNDLDVENVVRFAKSASSTSSEHYVQTALLEVLHKQMWAELGTVAAAVLTSLFGQLGQPSQWLQLPCGTMAGSNEADGYAVQIIATATFSAHADTELHGDTVLAMHDGTQLRAHACMLATSPVLSDKLKAKLLQAGRVQLPQHARTLDHHSGNEYSSKSSSTYDSGGPTLDSVRMHISLNAGVPSKELTGLLQLLHTGTCTIYTPAGVRRSHSSCAHEQQHTETWSVSGVEQPSTDMRPSSLPDAALMVKLARSLGLQLAASIKAVPVSPAPLVAAQQCPCALQLLPSYSHPLMVMDTKLEVPNVDVAALSCEGVEHGTKAVPSEGSLGADAYSRVTLPSLETLPATAAAGTSTDPSGQRPTHNQHPVVEHILLHSSAWHERWVTVPPSSRYVTMALSSLPPFCDLLLAVPVPCWTAHAVPPSAPDVAVLGAHRAVLVAKGGPVLGAACSSRWSSSSTSPAFAASSEAEAGMVTLPVVALDVLDVQAAWTLLSYVYTGRLYFRHCPVLSASAGPRHIAAGSDPVAAAGSGTAAAAGPDTVAAAESDPGAAVGGCECCKHARTCLRVAYNCETLLMEELGELCRGALSMQLQDEQLPAACLLSLIRDASLLGQAWAFDPLLHHLRLAAALRSTLWPADRSWYNEGSNKDSSKAEWFAKLKTQPEWPALPGGVVAAVTAACLQ